MPIDVLPLRRRLFVTLTNVASIRSGVEIVSYLVSASVALSIRLPKFRTMSKLWTQIWGLDKILPCDTEPLITIQLLLHCDDPHIYIYICIYIYLWQYRFTTYLIIKSHGCSAFHYSYVSYIVDLCPHLPIYLKDFSFFTGYHSKDKNTRILNMIPIMHWIYLQHKMDRSNLWISTLVIRMRRIYIRPNAPSYVFKNFHYKPKTVWRPSQVYNGNPHTNTTVSL